VDVEVTVASVSVSVGTKVEVVEETEVMDVEATMILVKVVKDELVIDKLVCVAVVIVE
jgi:hypothetical protein